MLWAGLGRILNHLMHRKLANWLAFKAPKWLAQSLTIVVAIELVTVSIGIMVMSTVIANTVTFALGAAISVVAMGLMFGMSYAFRSTVEAIMLMFKPSLRVAFWMLCSLPVLLNFTVFERLAQPDWYHDELGVDGLTGLATIIPTDEQLFKMLWDSSVTVNYISHLSPPDPAARPEDPPTNREVTSSLAFTGAQPHDGSPHRTNSDKSARSALAAGLTLGAAAACVHNANRRV